MKSLAIAISLCLLSLAAPAQSKTLKSLLEDGSKALKASEWDRAIETLSKAQRIDRKRKDIPKALSSAYCARGKIRFGKKKLDLAFRDFSAANRLTPKQENILQSLGVIRMDQKRNRDAERYMKRVLKLNPKNAAANAVLGQIATARDNNTLASEYMQKAAAAAPSQKGYKQLAQKISKEAKVEASFITRQKGNFRVQFEQGRKTGTENAISAVFDDLNRAYRDIKLLLAARPSKVITVVVYNRDQYQRVRAAHAWARAYYDGKLRVAIRRWPADRGELGRSLRHELTHAFLHELYPKTPLWLHEGLAQHIEGKRATTARTRLRKGTDKLLRQETFLGDFASSRSIDVVRRGYSQSLLAVSYLLRKGTPQQVRSLLRECNRGTASEDALRSIYRIDFATLWERALD